MSKYKYKKRFNVEKNVEPVSRYVSEGNPNTDKVIKETLNETRNQISSNCKKVEKE